MSWVERLLDAYPAETGMPPRLLGEAVDKHHECAGVCLTCADAAATEQDPEKIVMSISVCGSTTTAPTCAPSPPASWPGRRAMTRPRP